MYINKVRTLKKVQKGPRIYWEGEGHEDLLRKASYLELKKQTKTYRYREWIGACQQGWIKWEKGVKSTNL